MALTEEQRRLKNEQKVKERAKARAERISTPRDGAREMLVSKLTQSAIRKVIQKAKARARTQKWKADNPRHNHRTATDYYRRCKEAADAAGMSYEDWKAERHTRTLLKDPYDANARHKERSLSDPQFLIVTRLRTRLGEFMKLTNGTKAAGTMQLVGCTQQHVVCHLQSQIPPGESLNDYSIDHIFPMSMYNMECPEEQRRCMNWTNLQPMKLYGIGGNVSWGKAPPSLELAQKVSRDCWPASISESDLH